MRDETVIYDYIRQRIHDLRDSHPKTQNKTTQSALAKACGIERSTITNIELGNQRPPVHVLYRICSFFGIGLEDILPTVSYVRAHMEESPSSVVVGSDRYDVQDKTHAAIDRLRGSKSRT